MRTNFEKKKTKKQKTQKKTRKGEKKLSKQLTFDFVCFAISSSDRLRSLDSPLQRYPFLIKDDYKSINVEHSLYTKRDYSSNRHNSNRINNLID